jgi:dinuclear metal center YbgI/SA1388 family protein
VATIRQILTALEPIAPHRYAYKFDKVGLQVGDLDAKVTRAVVSMDRSLGAVRFAAASQAQLLLAHHPLIFDPIETVDSRSHVGRTILELAKSEIAFIAAHTNWDCARGGINDTLAGLLGLTEVRFFGTAPDVSNLKLVTFCPYDSADSIVDALSEAGAGVIGAYSRCAFTNVGSGQYIDPQSASHKVDEVRIEMVLPATAAEAITKALQKAHPYEEPAFDLLVLKDAPEQPIGRIGRLESAMTLGAFAAHVDSALQTRSWVWGDPTRSIEKVAAVGGAADDEWMNAQRAGADVLVTGEVKQHIALEAAESGFALIAAGHYATENPGTMALRARMEASVPDVEWLAFEPTAGFHGRPV